MSWLNRILVPVDLSPGSEAALQYGAFLADHFAATLDVLHVTPEPQTVLYEEKQGSDEEKTNVVRLSEQSSELALARRRREIRQLLERIGSPAARTARIRVVTSGDAAEAILHAALEDYDMVVMGNSGPLGQIGQDVASVIEQLENARGCGVVAVREDVRIPILD